MLQDYWEKLKVTPQNLGQIVKKANLTGQEPRRVLEKLVAEKEEAVISHYTFSQLGGQKGELTVFHDLGRAAIRFGDTTQMGDWDEMFEVITLAGGEKYNVDGKPVEHDDDGACTLGNI